MKKELKKANKKATKKKLSPKKSLKLMKTFSNLSLEMLECVRDCKKVDYSSKFELFDMDSNKALERGVSFKLITRNGNFLLAKLKKVSVKK